LEYQTYNAAVQPLAYGRVSHWTLVTLQAPGRFRSGQTYILTFPPANFPGQTGCYTAIPIAIDTTPKVQYLPGPGGHPVDTLASTVAFSIAGDPRPVAFDKATCDNPPPEGAYCVDVVVELRGAQVRVGTVQYHLLDLADLDRGQIENPNNIGAIVINSKEFRASLRGASPTDKAGGSLINLSNVLAGTSKAPLPLAAGSLKATKAPASKDQAWLWINGTVTAGTGAAPAWVLDGKIDAPAQQFPGPTLVKWATATANVGNNKIDGQAAKDVIDFSSPSVTWVHEAKEVGTSVTIAPTYETNLALSHRNMLVAGDAMFSFSMDTQAVRTAKTYFTLRDAQAALPGTGPTALPEIKMPDQGTFPKGFPKTGWSLTVPMGFEAGGALATTTVKNPKTMAAIGMLPTYPIARFVPQIDGLYQFWNFSIESYLTGRYLFTTEHTAVNNKAGIPSLETVSGWKAVNVLTFTYAPGASPHIKFNVAYTEGFSAPTYQRANGVKIGLAVAY
jgi:hypothetical protein